MARKAKIKTIDVQAKEWFDRVNGNSYCAGQVTINFGTEQERQALVAALAERSRLDPDAPTAIAFKEPSDNSQLSNTQNALRNLYKAVQKSRAVNDPLGMATAMEEAGKWF